MKIKFLLIVLTIFMFVISLNCFSCDPNDGWECDEDSCILDLGNNFFDDEEEEE